jgi:hypothetical protein
MEVLSVACPLAQAVPVGFGSKRLDARLSPEHGGKAGNVRAAFAFYVVVIALGLVAAVLVAFTEA